MVRLNKNRHHEIVELIRDENDEAVGMYYQIRTLGENHIRLKQPQVSRGIVSTRAHTKIQPAIEVLAVRQKSPSARNTPCILFSIQNNEVSLGTVSLTGQAACSLW